MFSDLQLQTETVQLPTFQDIAVSLAQSELELGLLL